MELKVMLSRAGQANFQRTLALTAGEWLAFSSIVRRALELSDALASCKASHMLASNFYEGTLTYKSDHDMNSKIAIDGVEFDISADAGIRIVMTAPDGLSMVIGPLRCADLNAMVADDVATTCAWCAMPKGQDAANCGICDAECASGCL
ncbi:MAG: hypothetical protein ACREX4_22760 [Gammaproteobacteria bacterium]